MVKEVFKCHMCGQCCRGEGGIYLPRDKAEGPAGLLGISTEDFIEHFTEPKYDMLALRIDKDGYCMLFDRDSCTCGIHSVKPEMCRDWPFFYGILQDREAFEDAKEGCPGFLPDVTWEDFVEYHRVHIKILPSRSYIFKSGEKKKS